MSARTRKYEVPARYDVYKPHTIAALEMARCKGVIFRDEVEGVEADNQSYILMFMGKRLNLSDLTALELAKLREFWNLAIEEAMEHVVRLDEQAQEAFDNGGPPHPRMYRPNPVLAIFKERKQ